uniref:TPT domain-containing protein n=1 Tax=Panagrellus redivivus TaxID=6233 RepID=A0A7E4UXQ7_PANRE
MAAASSASGSGSVLPKVLSAVFYGAASILIVFVNKILLTNMQFPSFLWVGIGQMAATVFLLFVGSELRIVSFPRLDRTIPRKIFPLPLFYVLNLVSGLGGTQKINLPMFTVLRRFSIFLTMLLEWALLGVAPPFAVKFSVFLMIFGSFVAAIYDLAFDSYGYILIMINNFCTAANGVYVKKKLESKDLGKWGLMYYNALFMLGPLLIFAAVTDDTEKLQEFVEEGRLTTSVALCFLLSCICGFILNYALVTCSTHNSALTTTCVGPIKNLFVTYMGMISSGDYIFSWANFIGVNISVGGSVLYTYVTFRTKSVSAPRTITVRAKPTEKRLLLEP